jgi:hypothetical protein
VLGGDPGCLALAVPCRSLAEMRLLLTVNAEGKPLGGELKQKVDKLAGGFEGTPPGLFVLKLDRDALRKLAEESAQSCLVRTVFDENGPPPQPTTDFGSGTVYQYGKPSLQGGTATFRVSRSELESAVLTGFWILTRYDDSNTASPTTYPTLRAQGPIRKRVEGGTLVLPLRGAAPDDQNLGVWDVLNNVKDVNKYLEAAKDGDFINNPYPGTVRRPSNFQILGRGIDDLWLLRLQGRGVNKPKTLPQVEEIRLVFSYRSPVKLPPRPVGTPLRSLDLSFLAAAPKGEAVSDESFFGAAWKDSPTARRARLDAVERALISGVAPPAPAPETRDEDLTRIVDEELDAIFRGTTPAGAEPAALRPLSVAVQVSHARFLLGVLTAALKEEYLEPLAAAAGTLKDVASRTRELQRFSDVLAGQNDRFKQLENYVANLDKLLAALQGTKLTEQELAELKGYLQKPWGTDVGRDVSAQLHDDAGTARQALIRHVLARIYAEKEGLKPAPKAATDKGPAAPPGGTRP